MKVLSRPLRSVTAAVAVCAFLFIQSPTSGVSACSGGIAFDWAVAHQHGGIVQGIVESKIVRADFSEDLVITNAVALRGDPPLGARVNAAAGLPCDQVADDGETILLIYDIRGEPIRVPLYYVVDGPDALSAEVVAHGLGPTAPPTDALPSPDRDQTGSLNWILVVTLLWAGAIGLVAAARRTSEPSGHVAARRFSALPLGRSRALQDSTERNEVPESEEGQQGQREQPATQHSHLDVTGHRDRRFR